MTSIFFGLDGVVPRSLAALPVTLPGSRIVAATLGSTPLVRRLLPHRNSGSLPFCVLSLTLVAYARQTPPTRLWGQTIEQLAMLFILVVDPGQLQS